MSNGTILLYFAKKPLILYCITRKNGETRPRGARRPGLGVIKGIGGRIQFTVPYTRYTLHTARNARRELRAGAGCVSSVRASACQAGGGKAREFNGDEIRKLRRHDLLNCELVPSLGVVSDVPQAPASHIQLHPGNCTHHHTAVSSQAIIVMLVASLPIVDRLRVGVHCTCSDTRQVKNQDYLMYGKTT